MIALLETKGLHVLFGLIKKMHQVVLKDTVTFEQYDRCIQLLDSLGIALETIGEHGKTL